MCIRDRLTDKEFKDSYVEYTLLYDTIANRISIEDVQAKDCLLYTSQTNSIFCVSLLRLLNVLRLVFVGTFILVFSVHKLVCSIYVYKRQPLHIPLHHIYPDCWSLHGVKYLHNPCLPQQMCIRDSHNTAGSSCLMTRNASKFCSTTTISYSCLLYTSRCV